MRRIQVDNARRKKTEKHGGRRKRIDLSQAEPVTDADPDALLDLDEMLTVSPELTRQPTATLYVLGAALIGTGEIPLEIDVLRRVQWIYPGDFWINHRLGVSLIWLKTPDRVARVSATSGQP